MALASSTSFTTSRVTRHLLANLWVLRQFLPVQVELEGQEGAEGRVTIRLTPRPTKPSR
jgi:RNA 3'-terminal phosphate cyclase